MTTPIAGFQAATPIEPLNYWALQVTDTSQAVEISQALAAAVAANLIANGTSIVNTRTGTVGWDISITDLNGNDKRCTTGDYIVLGYSSQGTLCSIGLYNGSSGTYDNPPFSSQFTVTAPVS